MKFELTPEQIKKVQGFHKKHKKIYTGSIGGGEKYSFMPTGLGCCVVFTCKCGEELDLTETDKW